MTTTNLISPDEVLPNPERIESISRCLEAYGRAVPHRDTQDDFDEAAAVLRAYLALSERVGELERATRHAEAEARRFARFYPEASDARNTFILFADGITALAQPNKEPINGK